MAVEKNLHSKPWGTGMVWQLVFLYRKAFRRINDELSLINCFLDRETARFGDMSRILWTSTTLGAFPRCKGRI